MKKHNKGIHVFRRDLRINDNISLNNALFECDEVLCVFILDKKQKKHDYFSYNGFDFMIESLSDLSKMITDKRGILNIIEDDINNAIKHIIKEYKPDAIYVNEDYTPYSILRDNQIRMICDENNIQFKQYTDYIFTHPKLFMSLSHKPYNVFTPFYNSIKKIRINEPATIEGKFSNRQINGTIKQLPQKFNISKKRTILGGRKNALEIIDNILSYNDYNDKKDFPSYDSTTKLSAHLKFGTLSIREAYYYTALALGEEHPLIRQLVWREFYYHIAFHYPHIFGNSFKKEYTNLEWNNNQEYFELWKKGMTGFPIVDAGMRELSETGFMQNRVRMIVASFLTKDLHIDWKLGEKHFANYLVDYDPIVNNGNWQWAASTGCDSQPYFRIFNPWLQQKKFDPETNYIKEWVPELKNNDIKTIHSWDKNHDNKKYMKPIIEHDIERKIALERFKRNY